MIFELFHIFTICGWLSDIALIYFSIKSLFNLDIKCLIYPIFYIFVEYVEHMPFFDYFCNLYTDSYKKYFKYERSKVKYLPGEKKDILLMGPHGIFINSMIAFAFFNISRKNMKKTKIFVSPLLIYNPFVNLLCKIIQNGNKVLPLTHKSVNKNMKENKYNLCVSSGGFHELNLFRDGKNIVYTKKWKYWIYHAIKYNYNVTFSYCYGGSQDYRSLLGEKLLWLREKLADMKIPFNFFYGKYGILPFNNIKLSEVMLRFELPYIPNITKEEAKTYYDKFNTEVLDMLLKSQPSEGQDKFVIIS